MKRFLNVLILLIFVSGIAIGGTMDNFINYCSKIKDTNILKTNRFDFDNALGMEIETGYMLIFPDAPKNVISNIERKMNEINDSHFLPIVQQKDNGNIIKVFFEQNNSKLKRIVVVTIDGNQVNILNVKGTISGQFKK